MPIVHTSSLTPSNIDLKADNVPADLLKCSTELRHLADQFENMSKIIQEKNIKITAVGGHAACGSFEVDEIDAARLRLAGCLVDFREQPAATENVLPTIPEKAFFIDPNFDHILEKVGVPSVDHPEDEFSESDADLAPPELYDAEEAPSSLEESVVDVQVNFDPETNQMQLNFSVLDAGQDFKDVTFDPVSLTFDYYCDACDVKHTETLQNVYSSLSVVVGMISQLQQSDTQKGRQISQAFQTLEDNLRLLRHLLRSEFLPELEDDHDDHDHDDQEDAQ